MQGVICYIKLLLVGGDQVINDIVYGVYILIVYVEEIKIKYVCVLVQFVYVDEIIQVFSVGDCLLWWLVWQLFVQSVQVCYEEIFEMVQDELCCFGYDSLIVVGIVFIGGVVCMEGVFELVEELFYKMVCVGVLQYVSGLGEVMFNLLYFIGVGLLLYGVCSGGVCYGGLVGGVIGGLLDKLCGWFKKNF